MSWLLLGILLVLVVASLPARRALAARRERQLEQREAFRVNRKLIDEDDTVFGEQVAELHIDTLAAELDPVMQVDYRSALTAYDQAKDLLARQDGTELPQRREECFFNPQHGPAMTEVTWTGCATRPAAAGSSSRPARPGAQIRCSRRAASATEPLIEG